MQPQPVALSRLRRSSVTSAHFSSGPAGRLRQLPAARLTGGLNPPHRWALILLRRKETITLLSLGSVLGSAPADRPEQKQSPPPAKSGGGARRSNTRLHSPPPPSAAGIHSLWVKMFRSCLRCVLGSECHNLRPQQNPDA